MTRVPNVQTKINAVLHWLTDTHPDSRALLFVRTKEDAKLVGQSLAQALPNQVAEIHSNKAQHSRLAAMSRFREGETRVLVSTDVSARGIDVPETEVVINFNVPRMSDDYVHRIGRTGRADRRHSVHLGGPDGRSKFEAHPRPSSSRWTSRGLGSVVPGRAH